MDSNLYIMELYKHTFSLSGKVNNGIIKEVTEDMEENKVKLISIDIEKLYGYYDYHIDFNSDVTFIYGLNGCGKTTILNITEAIITGQLFKLFNYNFKKIKLEYAKNYDENDIKYIKIISKKQMLQVEFQNETHNIELITLENNNRTAPTSRDFLRLYFNRYDFLMNIRDIFNYVYLPLNRSYASMDEIEGIYTYPRFHNRISIDDENYIGIDNKDRAMLKIESIIYKFHSKANSKINRINDSFRNNMLKPQIELNNTYNFKNFLNELKSNDVASLEKTKKAYIKILKDFALINEEEEYNYIEFFQAFINDFSEFINDEKDGIPVELAFKFQEITRIQKTIDIAKSMEKQKAIITKPMEIFLHTMNSFIKNSEEDKEICIDNEGYIYFKTKYSNKQISIQHLSSGEKQLITFFTNLIFKVKDKSSGIFVVDEPELSLHLSWQKIFIDKVLEVNKNIQLIFATHAPEIIGNRRDKMFKLEKHYMKAE